MNQNLNESSFRRNGRIAKHIEVMPKSGIREFFDLVTTVKDIVSLGVGEPDFVTPWTIREHAIYSLERGKTSYTSNMGLLPLRRAICDYVAKDYQVEYDPVKECLITVGVSEALDLAVRALVDHGDEVVYTSPCYVSYPAEVTMAHGVPVPLVTKVENNFALDPAELEAKITPRTKLLMLNFPCNPTGATLNIDQLRAIAKIAVKHDLVVITDEIYSELTYVDRAPCIASLPGMRDRTIFLHGFSKAFAMTGFRIGYACGPADIIGAMMKIHQYSMLCASIISQEAAIDALTHGRPDMLRMRESYLERRNVMVEGLNRIGLDCIVPNGAFYAFPSIKRSGLSSHEFAINLVKEQKVAVVPGTAFGDCGEGFVRCCYATSLPEIELALERMEKFMEK